MRGSTFTRWCALAMVCFGGASGARADEDLRPFLFSLDGNTIARRHIALETGGGYNGLPDAGGGLQPDDARRAALWIAAAVGLHDRVELDGAFQFGDVPDATFGFSQARIDLRVRVLGPFKRVPIAISLGAGYQADALLQHALTGVLAATATLGRVRLTVNVRAAHYFHLGRDPVDVFVTAGALVRATPWLAVGAEYLGEELEGALADDEQELGGPGGRHYLGPTLVGWLAGARLRINTTAGAVITREGAGPMVRGSLAYLF